MHGRGRRAMMVVRRRVLPLHMRIMVDDTSWVEFCITVHLHSLGPLIYINLLAKDSKASFYYSKEQK